MANNDDYKPKDFLSYTDYGFTYPKPGIQPIKGLIAHAIVDEDEDGTMTGGERGDQMGYELNATKWYSYPWIKVYRPMREVLTESGEVSLERDKEKAEIMATFMERAVSNGFIGYDQNSRTRWVFFSRCLENDFDPRMIDSNVSCDCSSLVFTAVYAAYKVARDELDWNDMDKPGEGPLYGIPKAGLDDYVEKLGFEIHEETEFVDSQDNLLRGDLLRGSDHWAMYI